MNASHSKGQFEPNSIYKPQPLRSPEEIRADIVTLERETEELLGEIVGGQGK